MSVCIRKVPPYLHVRDACTFVSMLVAWQALKAAFTEQTAVTAVQQDVSEFTHKLLEWIEIAFKTAAGNNE